MSIRAALERRLRAELELWNRDIAALEAKAEQEEARADLQRQTFEKIDALREGIDEARRKLDELKESGDEVAHSLRDSFEETIARVKSALGH